MKVLVKGPALTSTGYGEHCRFVLRALRKIEDLDIYLVPVNWGQSAWIWEDSEERSWLDDIIKKTAIHMQNRGEYDMSFQVSIPNEWEKLAPINIGVTAGIETTKIAPIWIQKANGMDKIITISEHSKQTFLKTAYEVKDAITGGKGYIKCVKDVEIVHYPVKKFENLPKLDLDLSTEFNFITVAQWGPRKNIGATITWFIEEFIDNPNVGLVVKTFIKGGCTLDKNALELELKNILAKYENRKCKIYLLHGDLSVEEMHSLYEHNKIHALVSLTHGEGFGLPLFEAAYSGLPVLATDWSGHLDFLYKPVKDKKGKEKRKAHFARINYDLAPIPQSAVWNGVLEHDSMWAYPQPGSYKMKLREVYKDYGRFKAQATKLQKWICDHFNSEKQHKKISDVAEEFKKTLTGKASDDWLKDVANIVKEYE